MTDKRRKLHSIERKFLRLYSAWQETHHIELAVAWMALADQLVRQDHAFSIRHLFQRAF